jgi:hypothetical protein
MLFFTNLVGFGVDVHHRWEGHSVFYMIKK